MKYFLILIGTLMSFLTIAQGKIIEKTIEYKIGNEIFEGYLAYDSKVKKAPGILVVHNWLGLTNETKDKSKELAQLGYVAFAVDVYGKGIRAKDGNEAGKLATKYKTDRTLFRSRLNAGLEELKKIPQVNSNELGSIGFCFGGTGVIELARSGAPVKVSVSFHGGLDSPTPADGKNIKGKILALHGAIDPFVSQSDLEAFEKEMNESNIDWEIIKYGGAVHSFTDPNAGSDPKKGAAYNPKAHKRSWLAMQQIFNETFKKR